ncbi:hypothetical protein NB069_15730 [Leclercia adecarboxylata]|uniref:hypothetical protein n=1 Tax=Leclercia adecarboxylata TaxID=83655 RepID=UPI00202AB43B|nr:hypothetical protein [Leclercia adecarboxylata]URN98126.1 hypothetical protein NB069_15730 [Leclercia adecarboxylata]
MAIGSNVHVWLTPDSPDGKIPGDFVPKADSPDQIHYYNSQGNANANNGDKTHTDIFVVGDHTGGYYQQGDWPEDRYDFRPINGITGNQGLPQSEAGKDYIFVQGNEADYTVTGVEHPQNGKNNDIDNLHVTDNETGKSPFQNANGIEGVVFGDGPSSELGGNTTVSYTVTLNLDVNLETSDSSDHLNSITLTGIPENATFTGNYADVSYNAEDKTYTLTFDNDTSHFNGQVSVELPDGKSDFGEIGLEVDSTASEHHETDFTVDGKEGGTFVSESHGGEEHADDNVDDHPLMAAHSVEEHHSDSDEDNHKPVNSSLTADDHDADHSLTTADHAASLIDDDNLMLSTAAADNASAPTASADHAGDAQSEALTLQSTDQQEQLNFSDLIHDEAHNDLSTLIQAGPQSDTADAPAEVEHVPAEGGEIAGTDGYDAGNDAMLESLIAKPEDHA